MIKNEALKYILEEERGLKPRWVARKIDMDYGSFRGVLCGAQPLSLKKAIQLASLLKVDLYDIWTDEEIKKKET